MQRQETSGSWVKFPKAWYQKLQILDDSSLTQTQKNKLNELWIAIQDQRLLPFPQIAIDTTRALIDEVFTDIFQIPVIDNLRDLLSKEPALSMKVPS